ncbi:MAG: hypothetical protein ACJ8DX_00535, partial [Xanthobacteraceae bacterium]
PITRIHLAAGGQRQASVKDDDPHAFVRARCNDPTVARPEDVRMGLLETDDRAYYPILWTRHNRSLPQKERPFSSAACGWSLTYG